MQDYSTYIYKVFTIDMQKYWLPVDSVSERHIKSNAIYIKTLRQNKTHVVFSSGRTNTETRIYVFVLI